MGPARFPTDGNNSFDFQDSDPATGWTWVEISVWHCNDSLSTTLCIAHEGKLCRVYIRTKVSDCYTATNEREWLRTLCSVIWTSCDSPLMFIWTTSLATMLFDISAKQQNHRKRCTLTRNMWRNKSRIVHPNDGGLGRLRNSVRKYTHDLSHDIPRD